jgi:hypothetical protein
LSYYYLLSDNRNVFFTTYILIDPWFQLHQKFLSVE